MLQLGGTPCEMEIVTFADDSPHPWKNHAFVVLPNGDVLDPTGDQFGLDAVYLGPPVAGVHTA